MYVTNCEVGALTNAHHCCLARLVARASEEQVDLRACSFLERCLGGVIDHVGSETAGEGEASHIGAPSHPRKGNAFD